MRYAFIVPVLMPLWIGNPASSQVRITSTWECPNPDESHLVRAPDRPDHSFAVFRFRCTPLRPDRIAGLVAKSDEGIGSAEFLGDKQTFRNIEAVTMDNGDKLFYDTTGTNTYEKGVFVSGAGISTITGGTGKLKGIKGKVISKGKPGANGTIWDAETEYSLPK